MTGTTAERAAAGRASLRKGKQTERLAAAYLRPIFPALERYVRAGWNNGVRLSADPGDLRGADGVIISVKYQERQRVGTWMAELDAMAGDPRDLRILVSRIKHRPIGAWDVWLDGGVYASLIMAPITGPEGLGTDEMAAHCHDHDPAMIAEDEWLLLREPVKISFNHLAEILVRAGYDKSAGGVATEVTGEDGKITEAQAVAVD